MKRSHSVKAALSEARKSPKYWSAMSGFQFGEGLRRLMIEEGLKQKDLAEKLGTSSAWVSKVLNGTENLTLNKMSEIAVQLGAAVHIHVARQDQFVDWSEISKDQGAVDSWLESSVEAMTASLEAMNAWVDAIARAQTAHSSLDDFEIDMLPSVQEATTGDFVYAQEESQATTEDQWVH